MAQRQPLTIEQKAVRRRARLDKRRREELPLLAAAGDAVLNSVAPLQSVQGIKADYERWRADLAERLQKGTRRNFEELTRLHELAARYLTEDEVLRIDAYVRRVFPPALVYEVDYWRRLLLGLGAFGVEKRDEFWKMEDWWIKHGLRVRVVNCQRMAFGETDKRMQGAAA